MRFTTLFLGVGAALFGGVSAAPPNTGVKTGRIEVRGDQGQYRGCIGQDFTWRKSGECGSFVGNFHLDDPESGTLLFSLKNEQRWWCGQGRGELNKCTPQMKFRYSTFYGYRYGRGITWSDYVWAPRAPQPGEKTPLYWEPQRTPGEFYIFPVFIEESQNLGC